LTRTRIGLLPSGAEYDDEYHNELLLSVFHLLNIIFGEPDTIFSTIVLHILLYKIQQNPISLVLLRSLVCIVISIAAQVKVSPFSYCSYCGLLLLWSRVSDRLYRLVAEKQTEMLLKEGKGCILINPCALFDFWVRPSWIWSNWP